MQLEERAGSFLGLGFVSAQSMVPWKLRFRQRPMIDTTPKNPRSAWLKYFFKRSNIR